MSDTQRRENRFSFQIELPSRETIKMQSYPFNNLTQARKFIRRELKTSNFRFSLNDDPLEEKATLAFLGIREGTKLRVVLY